MIAAANNTQFACLCIKFCNHEILEELFRLFMKNKLNCELELQYLETNASTTNVCICAYI